MGIKRRLDKLELANFIDVETKPLFVSIVPAKDGRQCGPASIHHAVIAGTTFGKIMRNEAETEQSFARRVYAMAATEKHVEDMTDEELEIALAAADEQLALEKTKLGKLSDESLSAVAG
ncbi:hypothetical protein [Ruegeria meonggei]|uniref:hypothetical protein n=1 Tax=Ruegeria meonggei TaxID=1446476 RepID=UPI00366B655A